MRKIDINTGGRVFQPAQTDWKVRHPLFEQLHSMSTPLICCLLLGACANFDEKALAYSVKWKGASVEQRGMMADPQLCYEFLKGKDKTAVETFLGKATSISDDSWTYDIGTMGGAYRWTLWIRFDSNGLVENVMGDD